MNRRIAFSIIKLNVLNCKKYDIMFIAMDDLYIILIEKKVVYSLNYRTIVKFARTFRV